MFSFFGGGGGDKKPSSFNAQAEEEKQMQIAQLVHAFETSNACFQMIMQTCLPTCINPKCHKDSADVTKGESVCLDRCVSKFIQTMDLSSSEYQKMAQNAQGTS